LDKSKAKLRALARGEYARPSPGDIVIGAEGASGGQGTAEEIAERERQDALLRIKDEEAAKNAAAKKLVDKEFKLRQTMQTQLAEESRKKKLKEADEFGRVLSKVIDKASSLIGRRVTDIMEDKVKAKELAKIEQSEAAKARRLNEKLGRGVKLSREGRDFLDAFNLRALARGAKIQAEQQVMKLEARKFDLQEQQLTASQKTQIAMETVAKDLAALLTMK